MITVPPEMSKRPFGSLNVNWNVWFIPDPDEGTTAPEPDTVVDDAVTKDWTPDGVLPVPSFATTCQ